MPELFREVPDLPKHLEELLAQVPAGKVTTYGDLAEALGNRIAARWVGHFMLHHEHYPGCFCHRVVRADGQLGQYVDGGPRAKADRLKSEGVHPIGRRSPIYHRMGGQGSVDVARFGFAADRFVSDRPLEKLKRFQEALVQRVSLRGRRRMPELVGGVDVSYPEPNEGVAGYALVELENGRLVWSTTVRRRIVFPYITSYLAFRELPILLDLIDEVRGAGRLGDVLLVDGSGILHQRHAGIASHLGVVASLVTIGVTKKLLCGQVELEGLKPEESRPVIHEGRRIGAALRPTSGSRRPIFISPGHGVNLAFAECLVRRLLVGRRLPEPLYWADRLSRASGRTGVVG